MRKSVLTIALAAIVFTQGCDDQTAAAWNSALTQMNAELNQSSYGNYGNSYNNYTSSQPAAPVPSNDTGKPYEFPEFKVQQPDPTPCDDLHGMAQARCFESLHYPSPSSSTSPSSSESHGGLVIPG